jgi:hypothetical protein
LVPLHDGKIPKLIFSKFCRSISTDAILLGGYGYEWNKLSGEWAFEAELKNPVGFFEVYT